MAGKSAEQLFHEFRGNTLADVTMSLLRSRHASGHLALIAARDPAVRHRALAAQIAALVVQREVLDRGEALLVNHQDLVDKVAAVVQLGDRIPTDITRYEEQMHANTAAPLRHTLSDGPAEFAESLQRMFDGHDVIAESAEGQASWETLRRQVPEGLNFCASGLPYWTTDVGGFFTASREPWFWRGDFNAGVDDLGYRELFLRWFQYAVFLPMFRVHGSDTPREIWHFGQLGSPIYDTLVRFIRLRKALMPYLYSLAGAVHLDGYTMMRPLAFDFGHDPTALRIEDQFMLGPALLVCPITYAVHFGPNSVPVRGACTTRPVYLPSGGPWIDVWDGTAREGGTRIDAQVSLETIPVHARAGSILPLAGSDPGDLDLLVFPGADGSFLLYEDEGDGWGYETGARSRITLHWIDATATLIIGAGRGTYPHMPARRNIRARLILPGSGWQTDAPAERVCAEYHGDKLQIQF